MALCIALQLDLEQSRDLLARADWAFSPSSKVDLIVQKAIIDKQYDIMQLNVTLFKYTNEILGVQEKIFMSRETDIKLLMDNWEEKHKNNGYKRFIRDGIVCEEKW